MSGGALTVHAPSDIDAVWAALPASHGYFPSVSPKGAAGRRLRWHFRTNYPEPLLKEFARAVLKAQRMGAGYLEALRVVLGNQAHAERGGYTLEQNIRVDFATERVMRNIIDQMMAAGITQPRMVTLGAGRVQAVQCFTPRRKAAPRGLCEMLRFEEAQTEGRSQGARPTTTIPACIAGADVPF